MLTPPRIPRTCSENEDTPETFCGSSKSSYAEFKLTIDTDPDFSTFVHPPETKSHQQLEVERGVAESLPTNSTTWRHSGWQSRREKVILAMEAVGLPQKRRERFRSCGSGAWVYQSRSDPQSFKIAGSSCKDRFCVPCNVARGSTIASNLRDRLRGHTLRLLTLTIVHTSEDKLSDLLKTLLRSFAKLRRSECWKRYVVGGASVLECKFSKRSDSWHPHLHVVIDGSFLPYSEIRKAWIIASGGSSVVDIRKITGHDYAASYLSKYLTKPFNGTVYNHPDLLQEAITALHGRRMVDTFGAWRGFKLAQMPKTDPDEWRPVAPLTELIRRAKLGEPYAMEVILCLKKPETQEDGLFQSQIPDG